jgi:hypothetical protein
MGWIDGMSEELIRDILYLFICLYERELKV